MIISPPGLPVLISNSPVALSKTKVGDIDERGRLLAWTRLAIGRPCTSRGTKLKSVSSLFNKNPRTIWRAPKAFSIVVVIASAFP